MNRENNGRISLVTERQNNMRTWKENHGYIIRAREENSKLQTKGHLPGLKWEDCGRFEVPRCTLGLHVANA